jgi:hypothetical protein
MPCRQDTTTPDATRVGHERPPRIATALEKETARIWSTEPHPHS